MTDRDDTDQHPVDSRTRACCKGIGKHTQDCPPALRIFDTEPVDLDDPGRIEVHCTRCQEQGTLPDDPDELDQWREQHKDCGADPEPEPVPAIVRWKEMVESYEDMLGVYHGGDASMVMDMERPGWSDPDRDYVGTCISQCCYKSSVVHVAANLAGGVNDGEIWERAYVGISAKLWGDGTTGIALTPRRVIGAEWKFLSINLTAEEALEVADVLQAAVKLIAVER